MADASIQAAAVKVLLCQLQQVQRCASPSGTWRLAVPNAKWLRFKRVWVQGVVVESADTSVVIDDGSGSTVEVNLKPLKKQLATFQASFPEVAEDAIPKCVFAPGAYLVVCGELRLGPASQLVIKAHKVQDYSGQPNMESSWCTHVVKLHTSVYCSETFGVSTTMVEDGS